MNADDGKSVPVDPTDLARLKARGSWSAAGADAQCAASRGGHVAVEMAPDDVPRCRHCGQTLSPDALRRAGIKGRKA